MSILGAAGLTGGTLAQVVLGAMAAGLGVTLAFSSLIYCVDRAIGFRRAERNRAAVLLTVTALVALLVCLALVAAGLVLVASKSK